MSFCLFVCFWRDSPLWAKASSFMRYLDHTQQCTTVGRTPLDEWSSRHRDLYLITHDTHNRQTSMPRVGFKPSISAGERSQTYALDHAATGISMVLEYTPQIYQECSLSPHISCYLRFKYFWVLFQDPLDLLWENVLSSPNNHVLYTPHHLPISIFLQHKLVPEINSLPTSWTFHTSTQEP